MGLINKIFAVVDPTTQTQRALNRAVLGAKSTGASIHLYACIHSGMSADDPKELQRAESLRYRAWVEDIVKPIREQGIFVDVEIEWNEDWHAAIGPAATRADSDLIIKNSHRRSGSKRTLLSSSDWSLFRSAHCPVTPSPSRNAPAGPGTCCWH